MVVMVMILSETERSFRRKYWSGEDRKHVGNCIIIMSGICHWEVEMKDGYSSNPM